MVNVQDVRELRRCPCSRPRIPGFAGFPYGLQSAIYYEVCSGSEVNPVCVADLGAFVAEQEPLLRCGRVEHLAEA